MKNLSLGLLVFAAAFAGVGQKATAEALDLSRVPTVNAIVFDRDQPNRITVATHFAIFSASENGRLEPVSTNRGAFFDMTSALPGTQTHFASGYFAEDSKMGVLKSVDGGANWTQIGTGENGPVAFYSIDFAPSEPDILYAVDDTLQVSRDQGKSWKSFGAAPGQGVFDLAVSPTRSNRVYAASREGLLITNDGGKTWDKAHPSDNPATAVTIGPDGAVLTFIYGAGLFRAFEDGLAWELVSNEFGNRAITLLAVDPSVPDRIFAIADSGAVMISPDQGKSWLPFERHTEISNAAIDRGKAIFAKNCAACHGEGAVGERPTDKYALDDNGLPIAPPLNGTGHGWHHSDDQLMKTILEGSPRNERMVAWKDHNLKESDARDVIVYLKSLWGFDQLACQGARHMECMH